MCILLRIVALRILLLISRMHVYGMCTWRGKEEKKSMDVSSNLNRKISFLRTIFHQKLPPLSHISFGPIFVSNSSLIRQRKEFRTGWGQRREKITDNFIESLQFCVWFVLCHIFLSFWRSQKASHSQIRFVSRVKVVKVGTYTKIALI